MILVGRVEGHRNVLASRDGGCEEHFLASVRVGVENRNESALSPLCERDVLLVVADSEGGDGLAFPLACVRTGVPS